MRSEQSLTQLPVQTWIIQFNHQYHDFRLRSEQSLGELRERLLEEEARRRELETNLVEKEREVEDLQFRVEEAEITSEGDH